MGVQSTIPKLICVYGAVRAAAPAVRAGSSVVLGAAGMLQIGTIAAVSGLGLVKALEDHITGFSGNAFYAVGTYAIICFFNFLLSYSININCIIINS